jgi:hypothetical protein
LRNLKRVRETIAEMIGQAGSEDLSFILEPSKRARVDHTVAIAAKFIAIGMRQFRIEAAAGALYWKAQSGKQISWTAPEPR